jgi:hypothetical protein
MDSPARRSADLRADDLEIVGFNGVPLVECGRALPVVRRKSTDRYFKVSVRPGAAPALECDRPQLEAFSQEGRLTLLAHPLPLPKGLTAGPGDLPRQLMVLCVSQSFLDTADCSRPEKHEGEPLAWQQLPAREPAVWVTCASEAAVEHLLNSWGHRLLQRTDDTLAQGDWERSLRTADLGLCAAVDRAIRWRLHVRYAAAQAWSPEPERVRRTFDNFVRREFPTWSWEDFSREHGSLSETLRARGPRWHAPSVAPPGGTDARRGLAGVAAERGPAAPGAVYAYWQNFWRTLVLAAGQGQEWQEKHPPPDDLSWGGTTVVWAVSGRRGLSVRIVVGGTRTGGRPWWIEHFTGPDSPLPVRDLVLFCPRDTIGGEELRNALRDWVKNRQTEPPDPGPVLLPFPRPPRAARSGP